MIAADRRRSIMLRRLVYLLVAATAFLTGVTVILRYFSDILPLASTEPQSGASLGSRSTPVSVNVTDMAHLLRPFRQANA
jgi:hypothetical protein